MGERVGVRGSLHDAIAHDMSLAACPLTLSLSPKSLLRIQLLIAEDVNGNDLGEREP